MPSSRQQTARSLIQMLLLKIEMRDNLRRQWRIRDLSSRYPSNTALALWSGDTSAA